MFRLHTPYVSHVGARHREEAVRSHAALQAAAAIMRNIREEKGAEERWSRKTESKKIHVLSGWATSHLPGEPEPPFLPLWGPLFRPPFGKYYAWRLAGSIPHSSSSLSAPLIGLFFSLPFPSKVRSFGLAELTSALADGGQLFLPQPLSLSWTWPLGVHVRSGGL